MRNVIFLTLSVAGTLLQHYFGGNSEVSMAILPALIGAGGAIASSLIGKGAADDKRSAAQAQMQEAVKYLESIGVPSVEAQQIVLEEYRNEGMLTPELEQTFLQTENAYDDIQLTPQYKEAQLGALDSLRGIVDSGGRSLTEQANLERYLSQASQADRGRREAAKSRLGARGQLGSGLELLADLQSAQDANQTGHQAALEAAANQEQRALDAIRMGGAMGAQFGQQEFGQQSEIAKSRNLISQFNTNAQQTVANRNVNRGNQGQQYNLEKRQDISDKNTDLRNKQQVYNKELLQQDFNNRMKKAQSMANARQGLAGSYNDDADRTAGMWAGIGNSVAKVGTAIQQRNDDQDTFERNKKYLEMMNSGYGG